MSITIDKTVAQVVTENMGADHVFSKYKIDFCCGGDATLKTVCKENEIEFSVLKNEIESVTAIINSDVNFSEMDMVLLINYSKSVYHKYLKENIPVISQLAVKVAEVHWMQHEEVVSINNSLSKAISEIVEQLSVEEKILFPFINKIIGQEYLNSKLDKNELETLKISVKSIEKGFKTAGDIFKNISNLTSNYSPPVGACNTFTLLYEKLQEFEQELHKFIHFEINILFPKVIDNS